MLAGDLHVLEGTMRAEIADIRMEMEEFVKSLLKQQISHQQTLPRHLHDGTDALRRELQQLRAKVDQRDSGEAGEADPALADKAYVRSQLERESRSAAAKLHLTKQEIKREAAVAVDEVRSGVKLVEQAMRSRLDQEVLRLSDEVARLQQAQQHQDGARPAAQGTEARLRALEEAVAEMRGADAWTEHTASNGQVYYHHTRLNVSSWTRPDGPPVQAPESAAAIQAALRAEKVQREAFEANIRGVVEELRRDMADAPQLSRRSKHAPLTAPTTAQAVLESGVASEEFVAHVSAAVVESLGRSGDALAADSAAFESQPRVALRSDIAAVKLEQERLQAALTTMEQHVASLPAPGPRLGSRVGLEPEPEPEPAQHGAGHARRDDDSRFRTLEEDWHSKLDALSSEWEDKFEQAQRDVREVADPAGVQARVDQVLRDLACTVDPREAQKDSTLEAICKRWGEHQSEASLERVSLVSSVSRLDGHVCDVEAAHAMQKLLTDTALLDLRDNVTHVHSRMQTIEAVLGSVEHRIDEVNEEAARSEVARSLERLALEEKCAHVATECSLAAIRAAEDKIAHMQQTMSEILTENEYRVSDNEENIKALADEMERFEAQSATNSEKSAAKLRALHCLQKLMARPDAAQIFQDFDTDRDGTVSRAELHEGLRKIQQELTEVEMDEMMALVDADGDGCVDYSEFAQMSQMKEELARNEAKLQEERAAQEQRMQEESVATSSRLQELQSSFDNKLAELSEASAQAAAEANEAAQAEREKSAAKLRALHCLQKLMARPDAAQIFQDFDTDR
eukprot:COSAG06_NODE_4688_length_4037_cov_11.124238_1_plen_797_part_10